VVHEHIHLQRASHRAEPGTDAPPWRQLAVSASHTFLEDHASRHRASIRGDNPLPVNPEFTVGEV
jgi:hypothetical protein